MAAEANADPLLVLAPVGRDAQVIAGMLAEAGLPAKVLRGFDDEGESLEAGGGLIVTEEAFERRDSTPLREWLREQPPWSDFPIILLRMRHAPVTPQFLGFLEGLGKVTILERPLHPISLITAARSALRARKRQREAEAFMAERVRTTESLRASEARFRSLADSAPVLIWLCDGSGAFLYANRPHEAFFGRPAESLLGLAWRETLHPDDAARAVAELEAAIAARSPWESEVRVIDREGKVRWLRCEAVPTVADGELGYIGCGIDVTVTRQAAEELERRVGARTSELAAANRRLLAEMEERQKMATALRHAQRLEAVGQLTAGVAHDFNNLLTVVLAGIPFLERGAGPAERKRLDMMRVAAERGAKLTSQLLAFSRRQKLEPKPVDLNEAVQALLDLLRGALGGGYDVRTCLEPEPWLALVDPTQIEMIILNLAINARDAMAVGGRLTVATANATVSAPPERPEEPSPGDYVAISVSDTGSGMTPEVLERVFEPFFTTKPVGRGSGLGLSQVLGFATQSGGGVRIDTEVGRGTTVTVFLPRAEPESAGPGVARPPRRTRRPGPGAHILLVDDDDMVRASTALMLRDLGFEVTQAASGPAALSRLAQDPPFDLMLVDFAMPGMNGVEVAREAAAARPAMPVLFLTGYVDLTLLDQVDEALILPKPFDEQALLERLERVLDGSASAPGATP